MNKPAKIVIVSVLGILAGIVIPEKVFIEHPVSIIYMFVSGMIVGSLLDRWF